MSRCRAASITLGEFRSDDQATFGGVIESICTIFITFHIYADCIMCGGWCILHEYDIYESYPSSGIFLGWEEVYDIQGDRM